MSFVVELTSQGVADTIRIGRRIGEALTAGDVLALCGCLGAGKTHLAKGIALGLGVSDERLVNSPTFVLVNEYRGRLPLFHVDAYRLKDAEQLEAVGFDEMCTAGGVVLVEWADRVTASIPAAALWIELRVRGDHERGISLRTESQALAERLNQSGLDRA